MIDPLKNVVVMDALLIAIIANGVGSGQQVQHPVFPLRCLLEKFFLCEILHNLSASLDGAILPAISAVHGEPQHDPGSFDLLFCWLHCPGSSHVVVKK
jgi:hypothetical protein